MIMHVRRSTVWAALALPLAIALGVSGLAVPTTAAPADADRAAAPTTGRFLTTTKKGVVLVDEDGKNQNLLIRAKGAVVADLHVKAGTFIWSSSSTGGTKWQITNLFGADLGSFTVPAGSSTPAIDEGGYNAYWVRPFRGGDEAAIVRLEINDPQATPQILRLLGPGEAEQLTVSPDYQKIAVAVGGQVRLLSANGSVVETVPLPPGAAASSARVVWSPDSGRIAFLAGPGNQPVGSVYVASAVGDHTPTQIAATVPKLFDWAPDGSVLLGGTATGANLVGIDPTTGATQRTYGAAPTSGIFWSGLKKGQVATDRTKPYVTISQPACGDRKGAACTKYRHSAKAWRTVGGKSTDNGGSLLRYVIISAFQKRGSSWWGLVGNGKHPTWRKFPTRDEARYGAKERHAKFIGNHWEAKIPLLTAGQLFVVAKAADGAGNIGQAGVAQSLN
jgi:hypothetical protein